jgi:hypothetical protein
VAACSESLSKPEVVSAKIAEEPPAGMRGLLTTAPIPSRTRFQTGKTPH